VQVLPDAQGEILLDGRQQVELGRRERREQQAERNEEQLAAGSESYAQGRRFLSRSG